MEDFENYTLTKTLPNWTGPNLCAHRRTWQNETLLSKKLKSSSLVVGKR